MLRFATVVLYLALVITSCATTSAFAQSQNPPLQADVWYTAIVEAPFEDCDGRTSVATIRTDRPGAVRVALHHFVGPVGSLYIPEQRFGFEFYQDDLAALGDLLVWRAQNFKTWLVSLSDGRAVLIYDSVRP